MSSQTQENLPIHPGEVLRKEYLQPLEVSATAFAEHVGLPRHRIQEIVQGERRVNLKTAWAFAQALGTSPEYWINLQTQHDQACKA